MDAPAMRRVRLAAKPTERRATFRLRRPDWRGNNDLMHGPRVTPQLLLRAYAEGLFPMAERREDPALFWISPDQRGILPLDKFHIPRRLARTVRSDRFTVTTDRAFPEVLLACAEPAPGREQ